jgi:hypothetical protein
MNKITIPLVRAAALAAALVSLPVAGHAGESSNQSADPALRSIVLTGSVQLERVSDIRVGSSARDATRTLGHVDRVLSDGTWLVYKDFHVDQSTAHGTLVVTLKDGRVSTMRLVSPSVAVALAADRVRVPEAIVIAANR